MLLGVLPGVLPGVVSRRLRDQEHGQVLVLGVGTVVLVLALLLVGTSATAVYLDTKTLTALADSAAAAGASGVEETSYYQGYREGSQRRHRGSEDEDGEASSGAEGSAAAGQGPVVITTAGVEAAARADVAAQAAVAGLDGVQVVTAEAVDGSLAVVTLRARTRPLLPPWGILPKAGLTITATGSARVTTQP
ncbi:glycosyltransferase [Actinomyces sp. 2119]|uniref:glycosyltransferase n=1 Tax=Actinomyces sp. 2119 TaxID=2321393 RepID=UPI000E6D504F|nr:glycosyltransferase [Actinomyces sp. 2119]RJF43171.1 glycosyltransferase [Actinomyces sp. 2119]